MSEPSEGEYKQYTCLYCGYVYDEEEGAPDHDLPPGTRWKDVPEDWCCPMCSSEKPDFQPVD